MMNRERIEPAENTVEEWKTQEPPAGRRLAGLSGDALRVSVVDIQMPFMSMVAFMVKWAFAAIPAALILWISVTIVGGIVARIINP